MVKFYEFLFLSYKPKSSDLEMEEVKLNQKEDLAKPINDINLQLIELLKSTFKTINDSKNHLKHFTYLAKLLKLNSVEELPKKLILLFRASEHNFSASKFHKICDGKGPTLTIVRSTAKKLFGGYASKSWFSGNKRDSASDSFLFSLDHETIHNLYQRKDSALGGFNDYGPYFGYNDLYLSNNCNVDQQSASDLGSTYSLPEKTEKIDLKSYEARSYLTGSKFYFWVEEYEVFRVI